MINCMICYEEFAKDELLTSCNVCDSKLCGDCIKDFIENVNGDEVVFTKNQRSFDCPNIKCKGGIFNLDEIIKLIGMNDYLSLIGLVTEKISRNKEFLAIDNFKKFGDEKEMYKNLPYTEKLARQWFDKYTILTPCCNRAFVLRDGCMSIKCECGQSFCGLCLKFFSYDVDSNGPCHTHVKLCPENKYCPGYIFTPEWCMSLNNKFRVSKDLQIFLYSLLDDEKFDLLFEFCESLKPLLKDYNVIIRGSGEVRIKLTNEEKPFFNLTTHDTPPPTPEIVNRNFSPIKNKNKAAGKRRCSYCCKYEQHDRRTCPKRLTDITNNTEEL